MGKNIGKRSTKSSNNKENFRINIFIKLKDN